MPEGITENELYKTLRTPLTRVFDPKGADILLEGYAPGYAVNHFRASGYGTGSCFIRKYPFGKIGAPSRSEMAAMRIRCLSEICLLILKCPA